MPFLNTMTLWTWTPPPPPPAPIAFCGNEDLLYPGYYLTSQITKKVEIPHVFYNDSWYILYFVLFDFIKTKREDQMGNLCFF